MTVEGAHIMRPKGSAIFSLSGDACMDRRTTASIVETGFSRVPVRTPFSSHGPDAVYIGYLVVKEHLSLDKSKATPVKSLRLYRPICVGPECTLSSLLDSFRCGGGSRVAFVCRDPDLLTSALDEFAALRMPAAESHQGMEDDHGGALMKTAVKKAQRAELLGLVTLNSVLSFVFNRIFRDEHEYRIAIERYGPWAAGRQNDPRRRRRDFPDWRAARTYTASRARSRSASLESVRSSASDSELMAEEPAKKIGGLAEELQSKAAAARAAVTIVKPAKLALGVKLDEQIGLVSIETSPLLPPIDPEAKICETGTPLRYTGAVSKEAYPRRPGGIKLATNYLELERRED
eukprot:CAMPEP_0172601270 /NCGR_PEP_ID=MMETSP1068-20121228/21424_1 /TAXON_ID=35684 /ORGANISM="Pseudopedinella elastica, Strain CCMP716" /LENGTH=346 /DNA_ID=CAMNT_0013402195 /DNA_START=433 /DNA_END=1473 /DNA_ORIENTATION=-